MTLRLIKCCLEFQPRTEIRQVGGDRRGIYVLYRKHGYIKSDRGKKRERYDVLYVGMADASIRMRLRSHSKSKRKKMWTHFSAYAVWPNITREEIRELEGIFRHLYRRDGRANKLNIQRSYKALWKIRAKTTREWQKQTQR